MRKLLNLQSYNFLQFEVFFLSIPKYSILTCIGSCCVFPLYTLLRCHTVWRQLLPLQEQSQDIPYCTLPHKNSLCTEIMFSLSDPFNMFALLLFLSTENWLLPDSHPFIESCFMQSFHLSADGFIFLVVYCSILLFCTIRKHPDLQSKMYYKEGGCPTWMIFYIMFTIPGKRQ